MLVSFGRFSISHEMLPLISGAGSRQRDRQKFSSILADCQSMKDMAGVMKCGGPTAGCWLDAIPSSQDYTLSYAEICMSSLLRLGASLSALRAINRCIAQCGELLITSDAISLHASLEEMLFIDTIESYNSVHQMLSSVGLRCRKEVTEQFEGKQRPDIAVYNFDNGW